MSSIYNNFLLTCLVLMLPAGVFGHAQLLVEPAPGDPEPGSFNSPLPREDNVRMKDIMPCGGFRSQPPVSVKGEPKRTYEVGSRLTVHWKETNDHTGVWRFDISSDNEQSWRVLLQLNDGVDGEMSEENPRYSWAEINLPEEIICENCTFRLTQSMGPIDDGNDYYSCADITIR